MGKYFKKKRNRGGPGSSAWLTTYGDLMTLLLTFFVLLFTFSSLNEAKFQAVLFSLQDALGLLEAGTTLQLDFEPTTLPGEMEAWEREQIRLEELQEQFESFIFEEGLEGQVVTSLEERGLVIRFYDSVLFDLGSSELKDSARELLDKVGTALHDLPNQIRAEGHTDDLPIQTYRNPSNWELSTNRATAVVRYLIDAQYLSPEHLSAAGFGEYRPIAPNLPGGQPLNRRVDLVILREQLEFQEPEGWKAPEEVDRE